MDAATLECPGGDEASDPAADDHNRRALIHGRRGRRGRRARAPTAPSSMPLAAQDLVREVVGLANDLTDDGRRCGLDSRTEIREQHGQQALHYQ